MPEDKTHLKVVVVSPGDTQGERSSLEEIFGNLNRNIAAEKGFYFDLYSWDTDAYPRFHAQGPQGAIDESLGIKDCDIVIGMFWARFGTPVRDADSGTEHELRIAYQSWKEKEKKRPLIMLYFNREKFAPETLDQADQLRKVFEFKKTFSAEALYGDYVGVESFKTKVTNDLTKLLRDMPRGTRQISDAVKQPPTWLDPETSADPKKEYSGDGASMSLNGIPLYTFCGLQREPRDNHVLQDFKIDRQPRYKNPNPLSYLWADAYRGNSVTALIEEADPPHLSITFENKPASWASNVAIRPIEQCAVATNGRSVLAFETRLSPEAHSGPSISPEIYIAVRVVNGLCQHWAHGSEYGPTRRYFLFQVKQDWNTIKIPLTSKAEWWVFADGNHIFGPRTPDFSYISSLVIVFGGDGTHEPGPGSGTVLIRNVHLRE